MNNIPDKKDFTDEDIERLMAKIRKEKLEEIDDFKGTDQKITSEIFTMQQKRLEALNENIQKLHETVESFKTKHG